MNISFPWTEDNHRLFTVPGQTEALTNAQLYCPLRSAPIRSGLRGAKEVQLKRNGKVNLSCVPSGFAAARFPVLGDGSPEGGQDKDDDI